MPKYIKNIGYEAFENCTKLEKIEILSTVTSIKEKAFKGCTNLTVYCEVKKPLFGYPKGYDKKCFEGVTKIVWNYAKQKASH